MLGSHKENILDCRHCCLHHALLPEGLEGLLLQLAVVNLVMESML
jgi:hypothetical protein